MDNRQRGSIFILSLWSLLFLSVLALLSGSVVRQLLSVVERIETRGILYDAAESGILVALDVISTLEQRDISPGVSSLGDFWTNSPQLFERIPLDRAYTTVAYEYTQGAAGLRQKCYGVIDEERKLNLNHAPVDVLGRFFEQQAHLSAEQALALANAVIDWRDKDDTVSGGEVVQSESSCYRAEGYSYVSKNAPFGCVEELLLVRGMNLDIFLAVRDYVTVFGSGLININTAPSAVLAALGMDAAIVGYVISFRSGPDLIEGTFDDSAFSSVGGVIEAITRGHSISEEQRASLGQLVASGILTVSSDIFAAVGTSRLENKETYGTIRCIFDRGGNIYYWGCLYTQ